VFFIVRITHANLLQATSEGLLVRNTPSCEHKHSESESCWIGLAPNQTEKTLQTQPLQTRMWPLTLKPARLVLCSVCLYSTTCIQISGYPCIFLRRRPDEQKLCLASHRDNSLLTARHDPECTNTLPHMICTCGSEGVIQMTGGEFTELLIQTDEPNKKVSTIGIVQRCQQ
jgi:hypothetical protein